MSLHNAANYLAAHGRGDDTVLVHMTPKEVGSLQAVAKAHGGSLTINPHTGLAEAGFLRGLLPTLLGAGLAATGVGAPLAALMVGGGYTVASGGDLKKGLMAGLGAYGGAGMANSFGAAGASSVPTATPVTPTAAPVSEAFAASPGVTPGTPVTGGVPIQGTPLAPMTPAPVNTVFPDSPYSTGASAYNSAVPTPAVPAGNVSNLANAAPEQMGYTAGTQPSTIPRAYEAMSPTDRVSAIKSGASFDNAGKFIADNKYTTAGTAASIYSGSKEEPKAPDPADPGMIRPYTYERNKNVDAFQDASTSGYAPLSSKERRYFTDDKYTALTPYKAPGPEYKAAGGPVEEMSNNAAMGANTMYPMSNMATSSFATPYQTPQSTNMLANMVAPSGGGAVNMMSGEPSMQGTRMAGGGEVQRFGLGGMSIDPSFDPQNAPEGGIGSLIRTVMAGRQKQSSNPRQYTYDPQSQQYTEVQQGTAVPALAMGGALGGYSDGGRMLKGPGDGMSDNIPAVIGKKQPARLADGEFVVPADVVSHLGNGSTDAGAKQLYAMMDKIRAARTGTKKQGKQINPRKYMPA